MLVLLGAMVFFVNRLVTPMLRSRLHTLIVQGSDSLYQYRLGKLDADFFGGNVAVENLHIRVDSNRYRKLDSMNALPALTMQLDLERGYIQGLSVLNLLFGKRIDVTEVGSRDANIRVSRNITPQDMPRNVQPLWKSLQPTIKSIRIDRINLDGIKMLYRNTDTSESVKLQFDRCVALFEDVRVDSLAAADTSRIAFTKNITLHFLDLKFRTPDSAYKMKAETVHYSSRKKYLEVTKFKLQPTLEKEEFYKSVKQGTSQYRLEFAKVRFANLQLDQFINNNIIIADSVIMLSPELNIYSDKTLPIAYVNKYGTYPHQRLLTASMAIDVKGLRCENASVVYTEKGAKSLQEGTLKFSGIHLQVGNVTNLPASIRKDPVSTAVFKAHVFDTSPIEGKFRFYLDSAEGEFDVAGSARNISAAQLNRVAVPLGNAELTSGIIKKIQFYVSGDNYSGRGKVDMQYHDFSVVLRKRNEQTGAMKTKKFLTRLLNRFTLYPDNPGGDGELRQGHDVIYARPSNQTFFATVWKTIFKGMQHVMLKSGVYE